MNDWNTVASDTIIDNTRDALMNNGITVHVVETAQQAKVLVDTLVPKDAEFLTMTSVTLDNTGIGDMLHTSRSNSVRDTLRHMDRSTQGSEMNKLGSAPEWAIGSVHAVTQDGKVVIASNTGSQLPAYAYGSNHVVWVVGAQKIVANLDEAFERIENYVLPLESERAKKAYGVEGSNVSKLLIINKEIKPERITIIFVKEVLGF